MRTAFPIQVVIPVRDQLTSATSLLISLLLIVTVGSLLMKRIGRSSTKRKRHGKFVLGWMIAGWIVGGVIGFCYSRAQVKYYPAEADTGIAGLGLLIGWAIGMTHGATMLH